jgi:hypothetical protein
MGCPEPLDSRLVTILAACRRLARLAYWSAAVLTDTATAIDHARKRERSTKDYR